MTTILRIDFIIFLLFNICLINANTKISSSLQQEALKKNLTCEEFCAATSGTITKPQNIHELHANIDLKKKNGVIKRSINYWRRTKKSNSEMNEEYLTESSILFALTNTPNDDYLSNGCYQQLKDIKNGILHKDVWAIKVLDASGTKNSGFLWGNNYWLGSQEGCEAVQTPVSITLSDQYHRNMKMELIEDLAPFDMEYRVLYVKHNSPWQVEIKCMTERIIHIGLCLPKICTIREIYNITQTYLNQGIFEEGNIYDLDPEIINIKDLKLNENFMSKISLKIVSGFLIITMILLICAACLTDSVLFKTKSTEDINEISVNNKVDDKIDDGKPSSDNFAAVQKFIKCFDVVDNCTDLFTFKEPTPDAIPVINGLRSISCVWIMLFHVVWYMYHTVDNKTFLISYGEQLLFQYVSTAPLLVDVFFTISGFLTAYNFMKNQTNVDRVLRNSFWENGRIFGKMVLHRYLRLAPLYLVVTGMVEIFTAYSEDVSIFHIHERYDQTCSKYWWRNIFFVQNFFHHEDMCLNWTWSLACEMQFFIVATLLMFLYIKHPKKAKAIFVSSIISSIIWTYISGFQTKFQLSFDSVYNTGTQIYINPFVRVIPYLIGTGTGWYLAQSKGQLEISTNQEKCLWNLAIILFIVCMYSTFKRDMHHISTMSLLVVGRLTFSGSVCWMILGSATGRSVWWSKILECRIFQHFNKLSYAIYLLNPFIIAVVFSLSNTSTHADPILLGVLTTGFVVIVYVFSIIFSLSFEMPYCRLSGYLLRKNKKLKSR